MAKQNRRDFLIEEIESELRKDAGDIDGGCIDRRIVELCALDGISPPQLSDEALLAAARTVRARAAFRRRNVLADEKRKRRLTRRVVRGACAACCAFLFFFSVNYAATLITGSCLPSKIGIEVCCGTRFCLCEIAKADEETRSPPE